MHFSDINLLELRDSTIPLLASEGRFEDMTKLVDSLWTTILTSAIAYDDKQLRDETVLIIIWLEFIIEKKYPPETLSHTAHDVEISVDRELNDIDSTNWMKMWVVTNGSQLYNHQVSLCLGRQIASRACLRISEYEVKQHLPADPHKVVCQMAKFFQKAAELNTFERTSDTFMFETLRSYLSSARQATLAYAEGPMKILPEQFAHDKNDPTNKLVRPLVEKNAADMLQGISWETVSNTDIFVLLAVLLREQCDALHLKVFSNTNITYHECNLTTDVPQLFIITQPHIREEIPQYGIIFKKTFHFINHRTPYQMIHTFLLYIRMCESETSKHLKYAEAAGSLRQLIEAVVYTERIQITNPFCKIVETSS